MVQDFYNTPVDLYPVHMHTHMVTWYVTTYA